VKLTRNSPETLAADGILLVNDTGKARRRERR